VADRAISVLVHAPSKTGKTTFSTTGPKPLLFLDVEKAARFIRGKKIKWNPLTEAPPVADGSWEICVVNVDEWKKAEKAYEWLKSRQHPFRTVVLDSISELQAKAQEFVKGRNQLQTQDWGKLLSLMAFFCRDLRDLTGDDDNIIEAVIITAMTREVDGIYKPHLQGQIAAQIPYWLDITAYMYVNPVTDTATGEVVDVRNLLVGKHPNYESGNRVPGLPTVIEHPNVEQMLNDIFGPSELDAASVAASTPAPAPVQEEPLEELQAAGSMPAPPAF
jgi:hypothetical protein